MLVLKGTVARQRFVYNLGGRRARIPGVPVYELLYLVAKSTRNASRIYSKECYALLPRAEQSFASLYYE